MKKPTYLGLRAVSTFLDIAVIFSLASLLQFILYKFTFCPFSVIFLSTFIAYYCLSYQFMGGRTPAKFFTNLKVISHSGGPAGMKRLLVREVLLKGISGICLPYYLLTRIPVHTHVLKTTAAMTLILIIYAIYLLFYRQTWWEYYSGTLTIKEKAGSKNEILPAFGILATTLILFAAMFACPFLHDPGRLATKYPFSYPATPEVRRYSAFIKSHGEDPVTYMLGLFDKYDLVVISERMHPEYTQYELLFRLFRDPRFVQKVGNIFTEMGSVSYQDSLDHYLSTRFTGETELEMATARLQRNSSAVWPLWDNTNLFDMFVTINRINFALPDSLKIRWFFTDGPVNWETETHGTFLKKYKDLARDSLMATVVIDTYRKIVAGRLRKKALVIMNTYHGYGLPPNGKNYYGGTASYIMKAFPGKVGNIMLNTEGMEYLWALVPVQHGKWDAAFRLAGNTPAGFDFTGSPFGEDHFDARYEQIKGLKYKDLFTGFIFYTPPGEQYCKNGIPYEFYHCEESMLKRAACVDAQYASVVKNKINYRKSNPGKPVETGPCKLALVYNLIHVILLPLLMGMILLGVTISFFCKKTRK